MAEEQSQNTVKSNYTTVDYSYDNYNSCMSLGFAVNGSLYSGNNETDSVTLKSVSGTIALAPVLPNLVGKQPKKGVQQYGDYNSQLRCFISPINANRILKGIDLFYEGQVQYVSIDLYPGTTFELGYADGFLEHSPKNIGNSLYVSIIKQEDNKEPEAIYHIMLEQEVSLGYQEVKGQETLVELKVKESFLTQFKTFLSKIASYDLHANVATNSFNSKLYGNMVSSVQSTSNSRARYTTQQPQSRRTSRTPVTENKESVDNINSFLEQIGVKEDEDITLQIPDKVADAKPIRPKFGAEDLDKAFMDDEPNFEND